MLSKSAPKIARSDNVLLAIASQRATEKHLWKALRRGLPHLEFKEAELSMLGWIKLLFSRQVIQHFSSKHIANWVRIVDLHSQTMTSKERFSREWAPRALSQRVIDALAPKLAKLNETHRKMKATPFPFVIRAQMLRQEKQRRIADSTVGDEKVVGAVAAAISVPDRTDGDGGETTGAQMADTATTEEKDCPITPAAEVSVVRRRLAQVLVSPDKLLQLFRRHSVDEFARVVVGLYVQYERFDCPKPRVTFDRVDCVSLSEEGEEEQQRTSSCGAAGAVGVLRHEWQRVRLHVSRGEVLTIAQCQSPFNPSRFPFALHDGSELEGEEEGGEEGETTGGPTLLNPSADEIKRKGVELHMALISRLQ